MLSKLPVLTGLTVTLDNILGLVLYLLKSYLLIYIYYNILLSIPLCENVIYSPKCWLFTILGESDFEIFLFLEENIRMMVKHQQQTKPTNKIPLATRAKAKLVKSEKLVFPCLQSAQLFLSLQLHFPFTISFTED